MPYVSRFDGKVSGLFANLQPGYAEEFLPDDDPEVVAFENSKKPKPPSPINMTPLDIKTSAQILGA